MDQNELQAHIRNHTLEQAVKTLKKEQTEAQLRGEQEKSALALNDLGVVYSLLNRDEDGRRVLREAQRFFIEFDDAAGQGRALGNLAQLEERAGNLDAASACYLQAADLFHQANALADEYTTRRRLSRLYLKRGAIWMALHETARALGVKPNPSVFDKFQRWLYLLPLRLIGIG